MNFILQYLDKLGLDQEMGNKNLIRPSNQNNVLP